VLPRQFASQRRCSTTPSRRGSFICGPTPSVSGCSRPRSSRVSTCFRQISTSLWMCARALACGGRCCSRRRSCKRSLRPTARCLLASVSDGGGSGRPNSLDLHPVERSHHEEKGRPLEDTAPEGDLIMSSTCEISPHEDFSSRSLTDCAALWQAALRSTSVAA